MIARVQRGETRESQLLWTVNMETVQTGWDTRAGSMSHAMTDRVTDDARNLRICVTRLFVVCTEYLLAMNIRVYVCVYILRDVHAHEICIMSPQKRAGAAMQ